ncbi:MFS transporter, partial [Providencia manganoxydans]
GYLVQYQFEISTIFLIFSLSIVIAILAVMLLGKETKNRPLNSI